MSKDINVTDGTVLETLNNKVDLDGGNYPGSGLEEYINMSHRMEDNLTKRQITNCLLEVPQRIKVELADGVLTLKAGSEVIVPNGFEADGTTPKFDYVTIESDKQLEVSDAGTGNESGWFIFPDDTGNRCSRANYSGATTPTLGTDVIYAVWYDTGNNIIKYTNDSGATWLAYNASLPICVLSRTNGIATSIDQVFNGMGRIGSIRWVEANITGLSGQGRNEDGSINNASYTTPTIKLLDCSDWDALSFAESGYMIRLVEEQASDIRFQPYERFITSKSDATKNNIPYYYYDKENAKWYVKQPNNTNWKDCEVYIYADMTTKGGEFKPRTVFRAVDYNDFENNVSNLSNNVSTLSNNVSSLSGRPYVTAHYQNGRSYYRIWSADNTGRRWCEQGGFIQRGSNGYVNIGLLVGYPDVNYNIQVTMWSGTGNRYAASLTGMEPTYFTVYNGHTETYYFWKTSGYIN